MGFFLETNELPSNINTFSRLNVTLAEAYSTCAPARCIWEAQPTGVGICRFSGQGWARSRLWQCQSFAGGGDRPRRSAGTCHPSSICSAPYRHPSGCYSILNRSKNHLAVEQRRRKIHDERGKCVMTPLFDTTCWGEECQYVQKSGSGSSNFLLELFSQDHDLIISLSWDKLFAGDLIISTMLLLSQDNEIIKFWSRDNRPDKIISNYGCSWMDSVYEFFQTHFFIKVC